MAVFYLFANRSQWYALLHVNALQCLFSRGLKTLVDCTLVTCEAIPSLDPDDRLLLNELRKRDLTVAAEVWSDSEVDWSRSKVCVLRSTWDYHARFREFTEWVDRVSRVTTIWNPPELLHWNADKRYLRDLESAGVRTVPTVWARRGEQFNLLECGGRYGFRDIVIKPARGAATHDVLLVHGDDDSLARGQDHLNRLLRAHDALIQPYLESVVSYGERALVFIESRYSHAVLKKPFDRVLAVRGTTAPVVEAEPTEIELATNALARAPIPAIYARVDLLRDPNGDPCVSEVELIEPGLYFGAQPQAVMAFADALERDLATMRLLGGLENPCPEPVFSELS